MNRQAFTETRRQLRAHDSAYARLVVHGIVFTAMGHVHRYRSGLEMPDPNKEFHASFNRLTSAGSDKRVRSLCLAYMKSRRRAERCRLPR